jgi:polygalacturonase
MKNFDAARRELLKFSGMGIAGVTLPSLLAAQARPPLNVANGAGGPSFFDVRHHGATGDGKTVDTKGIQNAIDAASAAGGGTVVFPAGKFLSFSLRLKSYVHLYLSQGCVLIAADSPAPGQTTGYGGGTYDAAEPNTAWDAYQDYGHNHWHNSLIWAEDAHDFSISGPGLIWGKGLSNGRSRRDNSGFDFTAEQAGVGNKAIAMKNCFNVMLADFSVLKGGHFCLLLTGVDNLTIDNLKIDTDRDGMDIDCCKNVRVSNCTVNSPWDDAICPKSSYALGYARPTENVTITNCYVTGYYQLGSLLDGSLKRYSVDTHVPRTGRIKCGTESNGGFKNISISNCVFEGCQGLALESEDGALLEDIAISNITMRDIDSCPFFFRLGARLRGPKETTQVGTLRRVLVNNVTCYNSGSKLSSILSGVPGHAIEDVKFADIYVQHKGGANAEAAKIVPPEFENKYPDPGMFGPMPAHGFYFRHVRHLEMSHVEVQPAAEDARPAFVLEDVERADFFAITAPTKVPAFALNKVTDLRVGWSRAAKDTVLAKADRMSL